MAVSLSPRDHGWPSVRLVALGRSESTTGLVQCQFAAADAVWSAAVWGSLVVALQELTPCIR
jgi:hypothetical protein